MKWLNRVQELISRRKPFALITVLSVRGSTPCDIGAKMVVDTDDCRGSIGGGNLEFQVIGKARQLLAAKTYAIQRQEFSLSASLGQCCGGAVEVLYECIGDEGKTVFLFGAGHVGKAVVDVCEGLPLTIQWVDTRENMFPEFLPPGVNKVCLDFPSDAVDDIRAQDLVLVMTHSHQTDFEVIERILRNGGTEFVGLIGSRKKRERFARQLEKKGIAQSLIDSVVCPVGYNAQTYKHPKCIAISVAAQMLPLLQPSTSDGG